jgi:hypothetical protein
MKTQINKPGGRRQPATPEQIAWTDKGKVPTLVATGIIFAPMALPESFAELAASVASTHSATAATVQTAQTAAYCAYTTDQYYGAVGTRYILSHPLQTQDFVSNALNIPGESYTGPSSYAGLAGSILNYSTGIGFPDH